MHGNWYSVIEKEENKVQNNDTGRLHRLCSTVLNSQSLPLRNRMQGRKFGPVRFIKADGSV